MWSSLDASLDMNYWNVIGGRYRGAAMVGVKYTEDAVEYLNDMECLAQETFWIIPFKGLCIIIERPTLLHVEPAGPEDRVRLHCADGPALAFADGTKVWCWHGLTIAGDLIEKRQDLTPDSIANLPNAEIRRAAIEIYGVDRFMPDAGGIVVHEDRFGKLWRRELGANEEPYCAVEVLNGSLEPDGTRRTYFLAVPERDDRRKPIRTACAAVAWTYGLTPKEYRALEIRT